MAHALNWFEIPVTDFSRAKSFYETVLGIAIEPMVMGPVTMGMLSTDPTAVGGAILLRHLLRPLPVRNAHLLAPRHA
jgi:predicted enzyme related to lactoylglutathione lyase